MLVAGRYSNYHLDARVPGSKVACWVLLMLCWSLAKLRETKLYKLAGEVYRLVAFIQPSEVLKDAEVVVIGTRGVDRKELGRSLRPDHIVIDLVNLERVSTRDVR